MREPGNVQPLKVKKNIEKEIRKVGPALSVVDGRAHRNDLPSCRLRPPLDCPRPAAAFEGPRARNPRYP